MNLFEEVRGNSIKRNNFDLTHERKFSCNMGKLIPVLCQDVVPGDSFRLNTELMIRFAPMLAPIYHQVNVFTHYFFVPKRLVWDNWQDFITGNNPDLQPPFIMIENNEWHTAAWTKPGELLDFLGVPNLTAMPDNVDGLSISALPIAAYNLIYNEYYRDQNLCSELTIPKEFDGNVTEQYSADIPPQLQTRAWEKDYFTSALPWAQKGDPVTLGIAGQAPVVALNNNLDVFKTGADLIENMAADAEYVNSTTVALKGVNSYGNTKLSYDPNGHLVADLAQATAVTINELRQAVQLQKWLELNARGGTRYTETILAHFGVKSSDARLQRPEYLGGGKQPVVISEVLQTSAADAQPTDLGTMAGHGISVGQTNQFTKFFEEHGYVIGIMSVLPRTAYQQGLPKLLTRTHPYDFFWPEFANLGEQEVKQKELYATGDTDLDEGTFGYQSRYAEYKYIPSTVHGTFKTSENFWHMGRIFDQQPALNAEFVTANPTTRIFAVPDEDIDHLWVQCINHLSAVRPMPKFGTPTL